MEALFGPPPLNTITVSRSNSINKQPHASFNFSAPSSLKFQPVHPIHHRVRSIFPYILFFFSIIELGSCLCVYSEIGFFWFFVFSIRRGSYECKQLMKITRWSKWEIWLLPEKDGNPWYFFSQFALFFCSNVKPWWDDQIHKWVAWLGF